MIEAHRSTPDLVVLHGLRCAGFTSAGRLAAIVAHGDGIDVEDVLLGLATRGLVTHASGDFGGWGLTDAGRAADTDWITAELAATGARPVVEATYDGFLSLNPATLEACRDWQLRTGDGDTTVNTHDDGAYDAAVLDRLAAITTEVRPLCAELAGRLHRFAHYAPRLDAALDRARRGETDLVTDSLDSYHTVWFQFHEDLLATLDLRRET